MLCDISSNMLHIIELTWEAIAFCSIFYYIYTTKDTHMTSKKPKPTHLTGINKRLEDYRYARRMSKTDMCNLIGVKYSTYNNITVERASVPNAELVGQLIAADPELNARWLMTGVGEMFSTGDDSTRVTQLLKRISEIEALYKQAERNNTLLAEYVERLKKDAGGL